MLYFMKSYYVKDKKKNYFFSFEQDKRALNREPVCYISCSHTTIKINYSKRKILGPIR